ncbi:L-rhamnose mutarotase [Robertkochia solimangrovi]|uniref:L-rhamnose mutarotase n=1 Tax=Robertkochia solimangrovi TaxID=2213046 RepID=UPI00117C60CA|nr:L-rhamnose mutarotase [Robertkochia solimangrovi]TRZ45057.1 L-rhamnose mutarotase [Robertkochia solimangrovi]
MTKHAFTMKLKAGFEEEYKRRHDQIWPELSALLSEHGISDYTIYLDPETLILFAVQKLSSDFDPAAIPDHPLVKKWWAYMADIMETNPDHSPIEKPLIEVFHMD